MKNKKTNDFFFLVTKIIKTVNLASENYLMSKKKKSFVFILIAFGPK